MVGVAPLQDEVSYQLSAHDVNDLQVHWLRYSNGVTSMVGCTHPKHPLPTLLMLGGRGRST